MHIRTAWRDTSPAATPAQFNFDRKRLEELDRSPRNHVEPTITFLDRYDFELGGVAFELFATPGETPDALSVWMPKYKAAFVGDLMYDSFPNIYTLRGTQPRWALDYVNSLNKVLALDAEILLPSHGLPLVGKEKIKQAVTKYRDAIQYVHDETVKGMNEGKDVFTLMREIKLPPELDVGETYGKVSWSVRGIYDGYVGWFDMNPATMFALAQRGRRRAGRTGRRRRASGGPLVKLIEAGDPVKALRFADAALAQEPHHRGAAGSEAGGDSRPCRSRPATAWSTPGSAYGIRETRKVLDPPREPKPAGATP